ncbi:NAD(P)H-binding protein [Streptomonospora alba]|nr:NAD(P)H-binding protein [Streptomonospora alba]
MSGATTQADRGRAPIMVTGAAGTVGRALVEELLSSGHPPLAVVRPGSDADFEGRVQTVQADLDSDEAMGDALVRVRSLCLITPLRPRQDELQSRLVRMARACGVERIVKVSALGAASESPIRVHREHGRADRVLESSGVAYALLRPNAFMQNSLQWRSTIAARGTLELPIGEARVSFVDARDVAACAAAALLEPARVQGAHDLTGPEALGFAEIAGHLARATGTPVRYVDVPPERTAANMRAGGAPEWAINARLGLYSTLRAGEGSLVTSAVEEITGRAPRRFADFAAQAAPSFALQV